MQFEWNKWLTGMTAFKGSHGGLFLLCFVSLIFLWHQKKSPKIIALSVFMGALIICPLTAVVLLKGYTPFYDWFDLIQVFPMVIVLALGGVMLITLLSKVAIPGLQLGGNAKTIISIICVAILLMSGTTFHAFDKHETAGKNGVPVKTEEVFDALHELLGNQPIVLAAPKDFILYTRLYTEWWQPLYGRDLWSPKAASYINSGYDIEYQFYELLEQEYLSEKDLERLTALIKKGVADCVIVSMDWGIQLEQLSDYTQVTLNDFYAGIIKKDLLEK